jgi:hypothetical protein
MGSLDPKPQRVIGISRSRPERGRHRRPEGPIGLCQCWHLPGAAPVPSKDHSANAAFSSLANASDMDAQGLSPIVGASEAGNGRDLRKVRGLRTAHSQPPR